MRRSAFYGAFLVAVLCVVLTACTTSSGPGVGGEQAGARTLTLESEGPGAITIDDLGVTCTSVCSVPVEAGTALALQAVPSGNEQFAGWQGACSGAGACSVFVNDDLSIKAVFATYFLAVNVAGGGTMHVTPPGVDCSSDCIIRFDGPVEVQVTRKTDNTIVNDWGGLCDDAQSSVCVVTVSGRTDVSVETETRAAVPPEDDSAGGEPSPDEPGGDDPPGGDPPMGEAPGDDAPGGEPPGGEPPSGDPPGEEPPAEDPPGEEPPTGDPPIFDPPFDPPLGDEPEILPPDEEPPIFDPPLDPPLGDEPEILPPDDPPIFDPPFDEPVLDPPLDPML